MTLTRFPELMRAAEQGRYAVGYFESWNLDSLLAVADAAEAARSPVLLGFSGIYLPHPERRTGEVLSDHFAYANAVAKRLDVPACLVFNESPHPEWVNAAVDLGFGLVMYSDETQTPDTLVEWVSDLAQRAHRMNVAVEAEPQALAGVGGELNAPPEDLRLTEAGDARAFVELTDVDALAVNVGQVHLHGRRSVGLNLERLREIRAAVSVPLVLHGATSVDKQDLRAAIELGVQKVNVGSALKRTYFEALRAACAAVGANYNPYDVMGSGLASDVLTTARVALQQEVEGWMRLFGSAGQA